MTPAGFPHSDIPGSKSVCDSPGLIAAYHVLHRLLVPRHPPCALSSLTGHPSVLACTYPLLVFGCQRPGRGVAAAKPSSTHAARRRRNSGEPPPRPAGAGPLVNGGARDGIDSLSSRL